MLDLLDTGNRLILEEAHYIPGLSSNLVSVPALDDKEIMTTLGNGRAVIMSKGPLVTQTMKKNNLYVLNCIGKIDNHIHRQTTADAFMVYQPQRTLQEWHVALGHLNKPAIIKMVSDSLPEHMIVTRREHDLKEPCLECAIGKQTRSKQPTQDTSDSSPTEEIGGVIASDVAGKITPTDRYGHKYFVNYVGHASGFVMTYPMKKKSEQASKAMEFLAEFETSFGTKVKIFRSDRGGEYLSEKFTTYLARKGIRHQLTERNTSASNGKAERMHRTLLNATRTMLFACDLPAKFWSHALAYATYLRNRSPSKAANAEMQSPLAILTGKQPSLSHAIPFGANCPVSIEPTSKGIKRRAEIGRVLGVNAQSKAYDIWVTRIGKVITSKDIQNVGRPRNRTITTKDEQLLTEMSKQTDEEAPTKTADALKRSQTKLKKLEAIAKDHERKSPEPRRLDRIHKMQLAYGGHVALVMTIADPKTPEEALSGPNANIGAMQ
ncbi:hypothetical protein LEN26_019648 [Aphanomyces euteiches]|nr:hypothetical protein LEN26_019648 [Aphanomyces euteiches]KAH9114803.1 hypothetical protein AeMF1_011134 [Aphanomyces euteiches]KAH9189343.1 hypothetical protein AeNC1_008682 [Aphanomyces euteiches]